MILNKVFLRILRIKLWYDRRMMRAWRHYRALGGEERLHARVVAEAEEPKGVPWEH